MQVMTRFWLMIWSVALAAAWLLPNHYPPWSTFHMDAWSAAVFSLAAAAALLRARAPVAWHGLALLAGGLALLPVLQYGAGLLLFAGTAWVGSAYLIGFALALLVGARWEAASPDQPADGLFLAIGLAALVSVGLQLHQWFALDLLDIWSMGGERLRPFANFGQPNQLGTLLLWGLLASVWGLVRQRLGLVSFLLMAAFLLFGLALTQSRTAWVGLAMLLLASWGWRGLWSDRRWPWLATGLALYFGLCVLSTDALSRGLLLSAAGDPVDLVRASGELRPRIWALGLQAALQQPVWGYGWNQIQLAQLAATLQQEPLHIYFSHAHNLFLDLVLWCGIPIGLALSACLLRWFWLRLRAVRSAPDAVLLLFLLVVGNHAMLELPLHHAYFLLPAGLIMGALHRRLAVRPWGFTGRWSLALVWLVAVALLALLMRDYLRVESSYQALRFEWAHIQYKKRGEPPEVLLLTEWPVFIRFARFEPHGGMRAQDLDEMRKITSLHPSPAAVLKLAQALILNQRPDEARPWLQKLCRMVSEEQCTIVKGAWVEQSRGNPLLAAVPWPD